MRLSLTALSAGVGAVAMSLTVGAGVASADPVDAVINTTCNYGQVVAALNATDPGGCRTVQRLTGGAVLFAQFPRRTATSARCHGRAIASCAGAAQYIGLVESVAGSCNNY